MTTPQLLSQIRQQALSLRRQHWLKRRALKAAQPTGRGKLGQICVPAHVAGSAWPGNCIGLGYRHFPKNLGLSHIKH